METEDPLWRLPLWKGYKPMLKSNVASILDAMFAPIVGQFKTYSVDLDRLERDYLDTILSLPWMEMWSKAAHDEPMIIDELDR